MKHCNVIYNGVMVKMKWGVDFAWLDKEIMKIELQK